MKVAGFCLLCSWSFQNVVSLLTGNVHHHANNLAAADGHYTSNTK